MNNGINNNNNNNTYIGNFRVQQQHSDNSTSPHQMMNDGFKPFYKKYGKNCVKRWLIEPKSNESILLFRSNQQLGNNNYVSPVWEFLAHLSRNYV